MNRRLQDPFQSMELPETIEEFLEHGAATCVAFNRRGALLAAGSEDGQLVIWDFETYSVAKVIKAHSKTVTGVCWSRDGRYIVTSSLDQTVTLWNVLSSEKEGSMTLESAVVSVAASRLEPGRCLVTMAVGPPLLLDLKHGTRQPLEPLLGESEVGRYPSSEGMTNIAIFDKSCTRIIVAHPKGYVYVLSTDTLKILDIVKVPATSRVLGLHLNRKGNLLLANCDRCIRMFDVLGRLEAWEPGFDGYEPQEAIIKASKEFPRSGSLFWGEKGALRMLPSDFKDPVEQLSWHSVCFATDNEYVVGAAQKSNEHNLYIWNQVTRKLERILRGPKEGILDITWHPMRSILVSVSADGKIYIWAKIYYENWSAFAPDFQELEENQEYVERETEFDLNEEVRPAKQRRVEVSSDDEDESIDVFTIEEVSVFSSDGEIEAPLHHLPVVIVPQDREADSDAAGKRRQPPKPMLPENVPRGPTRDRVVAVMDDPIGPDPGDGEPRCRMRKPKWNNDFVDLDVHMGNRRRSAKGGGGGGGARRSHRGLG